MSVKARPCLLCLNHIPYPLASVLAARMQCLFQRKIYRAVAPECQIGLFPIILPTNGDNLAREVDFQVRAHSPTSFSASIQHSTGPREAQRKFARWSGDSTMLMPVSGRAQEEKPI